MNSKMRLNQNFLNARLINNIYMKNSLLTRVYCKLYYYIRCVYNAIKHRPQIKDYRDIPIVINNRNRYTYLLKLIDALEVRNYTNIIILDNNSTYPPLLEYYNNSPYRIVRLSNNLGYLALEKSELYKELHHDYFVYTDPDVVPLLECPDDFLDYFFQLLKKDIFLEKVGFSLKIDDLPICYDKKDEVVAWESQYFEKQVASNIFEAPIDTTFALHRPYTHISLRGAHKNYRVGFPYQARHLPWYIDSNHISAEEKYYKESATIGGHWTNGVL